MQAVPAAACNTPSSLFSPSVGTAVLSLIVMCLLPALVKAAPNAALQPPLLHSNTAVATAGYYQLKWRLPSRREAVFELQEAARRTFRDPQQLYRGEDLARVLSGRPNGEYFYRIRAISQDGTPGPWSKTVHVRVDYLPLSRAFTFFGMGALAFLATLFVILHGLRRVAREQAA